MSFPSSSALESQRQGYALPQSGFQTIVKLVGYQAMAALLYRKPHGVSPSCRYRCESAWRFSGEYARMSRCLCLRTMEGR